MSDRYTKADVARILENVNSAGKRLEMRGAGSWEVQSLGGHYLYLTQADRQKIEDLGKGWHAAGVALIQFLRTLHTVEILRKENTPSWGAGLAGIAESVPESAEPPAGEKCPECETYYGVHQASCSRV